MNEIQVGLLKILKEYIRVCEKHNLRYFVCGGTCLGAARHKGFIPWDDDIDVMMPREDYEKFLKLQHEYDGTPYFIQTWRSDPRYMYCFAKLRDSSTTYIESYFQFHQYNHGLWIDIFPVDGMSKKMKNPAKLAWKCRFVWYETYLSYPAQLWRKFKKGTFWKDLLFNFCALLTFWLDIFHWRQRLTEWFLKRLKIEDCAMSGNMIDFDTKHQAMPSDIYLNYTKLPFEDIEVNVPLRWDDYLTYSYGDWRQLPPEDKQVGHHNHKGCSLTQGYKEYMKEHRM